MLQVCLHANFLITLIFLRGIAWSINCSLLKNGRWECEIEIKIKIKMQVCARIVTKVGISSSMLLNVDICKASRQAGLSDFLTFRIITLKKKKNGERGSVTHEVTVMIGLLESLQYTLRSRRRWREPARNAGSKLERLICAQILHKLSVSSDWLGYQILTFEEKTSRKNRNRIFCCMKLMEISVETLSKEAS